MIDEVMKLMIVDDEDLITKLLRKMISTQFGGQFIITTFSDSEEAARYIKEEHPAIVVTDLIMPVIDGNEILRIARKEERGIRVIIATADQTLTAAINCFMEGADTYVSKPIKADDVARAVSYCRDGLLYWNKIIHGKVKF